MQKVMMALMLLIGSVPAFSYSESYSNQFVQMHNTIDQLQKIAGDYCNKQGYANFQITNCSAIRQGKEGHTSFIFHFPTVEKEDAKIFQIEYQGFSFELLCYN